MSGGDVTITMVYPILKTIVHKGYDPEPFRESVSLDNQLLQNPEARIPGEVLERLMKAAAVFTGDEHFGLHQGGVTEFADLGVLGYVMMHSRTVGEALSAYRRYNDILCSGFNMEWHVGDNDVVIRMILQKQRAGEMSRHCVEDMTCSVYRLIGKLSNRTIELREVSFEHAPPDNLAPYEEAFSLMPLFRREQTYLRLSKDVLDYPVLYSDGRLLELFEHVARQTMEQLAQEISAKIGDRVMAWMRACLPVYFPTVSQTAEALGMSNRTLQHKLKLEGTSYNDLSIEVRKELAQEYLKKRGVTVGDIAYALHFSEPSAFQSAFKRWTGLTPGQYREQTQSYNREDERTG